MPAYERKDHFWRLAKKEGKASRAAYKLIQLEGRLKFIHKGDRVVDLGAAPGGWLKEISRMIGNTGRVVGVDILPLKVQLPKNAHFVQGNIEDKGVLDKVRKYLEGRADVICSDMAPNMSGIAFRDAYLSYELALKALDMCHLVLKPRGHFVVKIFPGDELNEYKKKLGGCFRDVTTIIPPATRRTSSEVYLVAKNFIS